MGRNRVRWIGLLWAAAACTAPWEFALAAATEEKPEMLPYKTIGAAPELEGAVSWLNTDAPLRLADLKGKIVLLDFWTYCCINCMHVLPDLAYLEKKYPNELVVIGVHSAKFATEKETESIRQAILRYEIHHPVANDAEFQIWRSYGVRAWPTLVLIDPAGRLVAQFAGEGHRDELDEAIAQIASYHRDRGSLLETPLELTTEHHTATDSFLAFPGKLCIDAENRRLFISDSNHNRIVVAGVDGHITDFIGSGEAGLDDGPFESATFFRPQGVVYHKGALYIADTENHSIRKADLTSRTVETFGGSGKQARWGAKGGGPDTPLNSPWDLEFVGVTLYIAMAGSHQLWQADVESRTFKPFAGSGRENIVDGPAGEAQLAQPSGLSHGDGYLYFADSEVSAVRRAKLPDGQVETLVGKGLFEFADLAGPLDKARFQHPLGVCYVDGAVFVADTYNHRIKSIDLAKGEVVNVLGTGEAGVGEGASAALNEPSDVAVFENQIYIADTNNHRIVHANRDTLEIRSLLLRMPRDRGQRLDPHKVAQGSVTVNVYIDLPEGTDFTAEAPFDVSVSGLDAEVEVGGFGQTRAAKHTAIPVIVENDGDLTVSVSAHFCSEGEKSVCGAIVKTLIVPVRVEPGAANSIELHVTPE